MKSKVRLSLLLLISSTITVVLLLPFHILMRLCGSFPIQDFAKDSFGLVPFMCVIVCLAIIQIHLSSFCRIRNASVPVLCYFMKKGVHFRFFKAIAVCFLTCLCSFVMGLALGGEAPSVFMGAIVFAFVFSFEDESQERLLRAIRVGAAVGFSLAFMNPIAGVLFSFAPEKWGKHYLKTNYKLFLEGILCSFFAYALYGTMKGLIYFQDYKNAFYQAFLFVDFQADLFNVSIASLTHYWIYLVMIPFALGFGYLYVHGLKGLRALLWREKPITYAVSFFGALILLPLCNYLNLLSLGTGAKLIEENFLLLEKGWLIFMELFLLRLVLTGFSLTSHFQGGNIIPSLGVGMLLGVMFAGALEAMGLPLNEETMRLISFSFMLAFFSAMSHKQTATFALALSFGPAPALLLAIAPALIASYFLSNKIKSDVSLSEAFAESDIKNCAYAKALWSHYPYCSPMFEDIWDHRFTQR